MDNKKQRSIGVRREDKIMQQEVFHIYKPKGISPLDAIKDFKSKNPKFENIKMTYAGRLDPMAEGVLLIIAGKELKKIKEYLKLDKKYEGAFLFGFCSDTHDILGIPEKRRGSLDKESIKETLLQFEGEFSFSLPLFSAYKIKGKPLFQWKLENRTDEIKVPKKVVSIYKLQVREVKQICKENLESEILNNLDMVRGNFRQERIKKEWKKLLKEEEYYWIAKVKIFCSSGTYVRSIAHRAGKRLKSGSVLLDLRRTAVGSYEID